MRKRWKKILLGVVVVFLLVFTFWYGGNAPGLQGFSIEQTESAVEESSEAQSKETKRSSQESTSETVKEDEPDNIFEQIVMNIKLKKKASTSSKTQENKKAQNNANKALKKENNKNKKKNTKENTTKESTTKENTTREKRTTEVAINTTEESSSAKNENTTSSESTTESSDKEITTECTTEQVKKDTVKISIYCKTLLNHMDLLANAKKKYVPKDGVILKETEIEIQKGDTVFDVLQRATKSKKIHLEFSYTPAYESHYIEGIHNIYEFDAGNLSGWMYCVNGEFPNVGCSSYKVENGDVIQWVYTCDLGKDVGENFEE